MPDSLKFNKIPRIEPRPDSFKKVLARLDAEKKKSKMIPFHIYSTLSVAASLFFIAGALIISLNTSDIRILEPISTYTETETFSWFSSLGNGSALDEYSSDLETYLTSNQ